MAFCAISLKALHTTPFTPAASVTIASSAKSSACSIIHGATISGGRHTITIPHDRIFSGDASLRSTTLCPARRKAFSKDPPIRPSPLIPTVTAAPFCNQEPHQTQRQRRRPPHTGWREGQHTDRDAPSLQAWLAPSFPDRRKPVPLLWTA